MVHLLHVRKSIAVGSLRSPVASWLSQSTHGCNLPMRSWAWPPSHMLCWHKKAVPTPTTAGTWRVRPALSHGFSLRAVFPSQPPLTATTANLKFRCWIWFCLAPSSKDHKTNSSRRKPPSSSFVLSQSFSDLSWHGAVTFWVGHGPHCPLQSPESFRTPAVPGDRPLPAAEVPHSLSPRQGSPGCRTRGPCSGANPAQCW